MWTGFSSAGPIMTKSGACIDAFSIIKRVEMNIASPFSRDVFF